MSLEEVEKTLRYLQSYPMSKYLYSRLCQIAYDVVKDEPIFRKSVLSQTKRVSSGLVTVTYDATFGLDRFASLVVEKRGEDSFMRCYFRCVSKPSQVFISDESRSFGLSLR